MAQSAVTPANSHLLGNYSRAPITLVRGEGVWLYDDAGKKYLDFIAGIAVCALGHAHPEITKAIAEQAATLVHASNLYSSEPSGRLAHELARISGFDRLFFCNSGTEANEAAIKFARKRAFRMGESERTKIVACTGSFHGRTYGALAATDNPKYQEGFGAMPAGFVFTPFNDPDTLEFQIDKNTAAFIVEPVQGESGIHPASVAFLQRARDLSDQHGALLIFDEIQCGLGRLGADFAFQHFGVRPDLFTLAKSLANGLPIGALFIDAPLAEVLQPGDHGTTFGGSCIPSAAALAHLRLREELHLNAHVKTVGAALRAGLDRIANAHPERFEPARGIGLMQGLPVKAPHEAKTFVAAARERGLLVNAAGNNTIRILPPLILTKEEAEQGLRILEEAIASVH